MRIIAFFEAVAEDPDVRNEAESARDRGQFCAILHGLGDQLFPIGADVEKSHGDSAGVIAPPPLVYLGFLMIGLVVNHYWPVGFLPEIVRLPLAALLIAIGLIFGGLGFRALKRVGTNVAPHLPSTALATGSIYRYTRNPLYVALTLFYLGIAAATNGLWQLLLVGPLLLIMRYGVIGREERYLEAKFGDAYRRYKQRVRRWI